VSRPEPKWWQPSPEQLAYRAETARQARILAEIEEREAQEAHERSERHGY